MIFSHDSSSDVTKGHQWKLSTASLFLGVGSQDESEMKEKQVCAVSQVNKLLGRLK